MKYALIFVLFFTLTTGILTAQISNYYTFSSTIGTYTAITGTPISTILGDNVLSGAVDIGFTFPYGTNSYSQVKMSSNGFLYLGTAGTSSSQTNSLASTTICPVIAPLWDNLNLTGGGAAYVTEGEAPNRVFTCQWTAAKWNNNSVSTFDFQAKLYENGKIEFVYGNSTGTPTSPSASIGINMLPGGSTNYISVTPGTPATSSSTVEMATISTFPGYGFIYYFEHYIPSLNDMACTNMSGNLTPTQGVDSRYRLTIRNAGLNTQMGYSVQLMSGDNVLSSVTGPLLAYNATATVVVNWTPDTAGEITIYGKVVLVGDTTSTNDNSSVLNLFVQEPGSNLITIGDGSTLAQVPLNMYYRNSLFETIYQSTEIDTSGMITGVSFYNNFVSNLPDLPTKIWLGTTTQSDLSSGWIAATQLTQVFDGTVDYPTGANMVTIDFTTPFPYTGGNLVMLVNRPIEALSYNTNDRFLSQTVGTNRSRTIYSSTTTYDPANPPATGATVSGVFPKTSFSYSPAIAEPCFAIAPAMKDWGSVLINSTNTQTFVMMNSGTQPLTINAIGISGDFPYSLSDVPQLPLQLATGQTTSFTCTYQPTSSGWTSATITILDDILTLRQVHTIPVQGLASDPTIYSLPYSQNFDSVTSPTLPLDWKKYVPSTSNGSVTTVTSVIIAPNSSPNSADLYNNTDNTGSILLMAPPLADTLNVSSTQITFWARGYAVNYTLSVGVVDNPLDPATYTEVQSVSLTATWTQYTILFAGYTGMGRYITFKHGLGGTYRGIYIDDFTLDAIPTNDLSAQSILGSTLPMQGESTLYAVTIQNNGSTVQSDYTVSLCTNDDTEVASISGLSIEPGSSLSFDLSWIPQTMEATGLYGKVTLPGDQNSENDITSLLAVNVLPQGATLVNVGTGEETARLPFDMFRRNSLYETIYLQSELNFVGEINGIVLYNEFVDSCPGMLTQLWIGTTSQSDLSGGWIPSTELTEVYNTIMPFPAGNNSIAIIFSQPYLYQGGNNLVIMFNRPTDTTSYSINDRFLCQTVGTNRALSVSSNTTVYDPANPPTGTIPTGQFPQTNFIVLPVEVGSLQGIVYGPENLPLANVTVQVENGGSAVTDTFGNYFISSIVAGNHQVTASHPGFIAQTAAVTIQGNTIANQDFSLFEITYPPAWVTAVESADHSRVVITWGVPALPDKGNANPTEPRSKEKDNLSRNLIGYQVWRLPSGQENNQSNWQILYLPLSTEQSYTDTTWSTITAGTYLWAVKAMYTGSMPSVPVFSNALNTPLVVFGTLSGVVRDESTNIPISGATISSGEYTTITTANGNFSVLLPVGEQNVQCIAPGYQLASEDVTMVAGQQTSLNFLLEVTSNSDPQTVAITELKGNHPNPFTGTTILSYSVKESTPVKVEIFNIRGQLIRILVNERQVSGFYQAEWDGRDSNGNHVSSGVYYYKMAAGKFSSTRKMIMLK